MMHDLLPTLWWRPKGFLSLNCGVLVKTLCSSGEEDVGELLALMQAGPVAYNWSVHRLHAACWRCDNEMWLQASAEVVEPRRKKGKSIPHRDSSETALPPRECIQLGHTVVQGVLAVAGDAARLLQWDCDTTPAVATLSLASASLSWANELCRTSPGNFDGNAYWLFTPHFSPANGHGQNLIHMSRPIYSNCAKA